MYVTGSKQLNKGRWYAVLNLPTDTGRKKPKWIALGLSEKAPKKAVEAAFNEVLAQHNSNSIKYSKNILFTDWVNEWLEHKAPFIQQTTLDAYRTYAESRIIPYFAARNLTLQKMTATDIQLFYDSLTRAGLNPNTVRRYHAVVNGSLEWAFKLGKILENPTKRVELPPLPKDHVGQALSPEDVARLFTCLQGHKIYPAIVLCACCGLRREEVLGLEWKNVDLEKQTIYICKTVTRNKTLDIKDTTKNKSSRRLLYISDDICDMLHRLQTQQAIDKLAHGETYDSTHDFIMRHEDGRQMMPDYLSSAFKKVIRKNGFPDVRLHDLRHTTATIMLDNGADPLDVKDTLGHSTLAITTELYGHRAKLEASKRTAKVMESAVKIRA